ncbi:MAG: hypothetical protein PVG03_09940 [Desulfarculaceae bacterium]|jgi:nitrate reductase gamma subunit
MAALYEFLAGPAAWAAFFIFIVGLAVRAAFLLGLSRERDKIFWNHLSWKWGLRSIWHWLTPLGSVSLRRQPLFALVIFVFHLCLLGVPIFLSAHNLIFAESFGWRLATLPDALADIFTMVFLGCALFLFGRRLIRPEVRILTSLWDYVLLILTAAPFVTGLFAYHQIVAPYELMLVLHVLFSEILLIVIPFSKLGHMILFFFTRFFLGQDMGARREVEGRLGARTW